MIKPFFDFITGRSHLKQSVEINKLRDLVEVKDTELDCASWWVNKQAITIKKGTEQFAILANYVDRMASAIAGVETKVFVGANPDKALEDAIAAALEQHKQLLYARTKLAKTEHTLEEMKEIIAQMSHDSI